MDSLSWILQIRPRIRDQLCQKPPYTKFGANRLIFKNSATILNFYRHIGSVIKDFVNLPHQLFRGVHQLQFEPKNDTMACEFLFLQTFSSGHSIFLLLSADILDPLYWIFQSRTRHSKVEALGFKISPWSIFLVAPNFGRSSDPVDADCRIYIVGLSPPARSPRQPPISVKP